MSNEKSFADLATQHSSAIAQYSAQIKYQVGLAEPDTDLLHELKALYETEKQRLEKLWEEIKAKGIEFAKEVFLLVKAFFEELVSDVIEFLKRHNLNDLIELIKELF